MSGLGALEGFNQVFTQALEDDPLLAWLDAKIARHRQAVEDIEQRYARVYTSPEIAARVHHHRHEARNYRECKRRLQVT